MCITNWLHFRCPKTLVYCKTINMVVKVGTFLTLAAREGAYTESRTGTRNRRVAVYHAEVPDKYQMYYLEEFKKPDSSIRILVCTVAFGMGVSIPDVDFVIHWGVPRSILCYWQEVGRCARDGRRGTAIFYVVRATKTHHPKCDSEMLQFCAKLEQQSECVRLTIMRALHLPEMGDRELEEMISTKHCTENCSQCKCTKCQCCNVCKGLCPCRA